MKDLSERVREVVEEYFEEEGITDMEDYGASGDEGLGDISEVVADCLVKVGYPVDYNYAEDSIYGDGKYDVHIGYNNKDYSTVLKAWNGVDEVVDFIKDILELTLQ